MTRLHWGLLLELALPNMDVYGILPPAREVQLLLERKRLSMLGISSYEIHPASGKIVFPLSTRLYQCQDTGYDVRVIRFCIYQALPNIFRMFATETDRAH